MNQQQFNRDKTDKYLGTDLDVEEAWKEFEEKQDEKRPMLFLWFGLLLLIGATTLYLHIISKKEQVNISQQQTFEIKEKITANTLKQDILINNKESVVEGDASSKVLDRASSIPSTAQNNKATQKRKDSFRTTPSSRDTAFSKNSHISATNYTQKEHKTNRLNNFSNRIASPSTKILEEKAIIESIVALQESTRKEIYNDKEHGIHSVEKITIPVAKIDTRLGFPISSEQKLALKIPSIVRPNTLVNTDKSLYSFNLYSSTGIMQRKLDEQANDFQQRRANNETPLYRYAFGALVSKRIAPNFRVSVGLEYNNYLTRIEDLIQNIGQATTIENQLIAYQLKGDISEPVYGDISVTTIEIVKNIRYQQYKSLAIPMNVTYVKELQKGFGWEAGIGFSYHLSMSAVGKTYKEDGAIGSYQSLSNLPYRTANLIDFNLHTGIHKVISAQCSVGLKASYTRDLNSRILPASNFTDKFSALNLELGLTRFF